MFYKPEATSSDQQQQQRTQESSSEKMAATTSMEEERHDSGLDSLDLQQHDSSTGSSGVPSLNMGIINEEPSLSDPLKALNGQLSSMTLITDPSKSIEDDSGNYSLTSIQNSLTTTTTTEAVVVRSETDTGNSAENEGSQRWVDNIMRLCFHAASGELDMARVVQLFQGNQDGDNWLNLSIIHEVQEAALLLIDLSPDHDWLNLYNHLRQTPLHLAALARQPTVARRLICAGASVKEHDLNGNTALHLACATGCEDIVRPFLTPVRRRETVQNSYKIPFQRLPQSSKLRNFNGDTCLHVAARAGHVNIVRMLLEHGCDPNVGDGKSGRTVLHHSAEAGHVELTSLLLSRRETLCDLRDYSMHTPCDLAQGQGRSRVTDLLVSHGAVLNDILPFSDVDDDDDGDCDMMDTADCSG